MSSSNLHRHNDQLANSFELPRERSIDTGVTQAQTDSATAQIISNFGEYDFCSFTLLTMR